MVKRGLILILLGLFVFSLSGCATWRCKQKNEENQELKNQLSVLESQVSSRDEEINSLKDQLSKAEMKQEPIQRMGGKKKIIAEAKFHPSAKQVQIALKNAGYYTGNIDGKMGKQTKEAIKDFQKANNLTTDGKVGKKTWDVLKDYSYKKVK